MHNKNTKSLAEKIDKNSFGKIYIPKFFYYYSKEYIENFTKAGQTAIKHFIISSTINEQA